MTPARSTVRAVSGATSARPRFKGKVYLLPQHRVLRSFLPRQLLARDTPGHFFLCGPPSFMQGMYDGLRAAGVPDARIFAEAFGPASLARPVDTTGPSARRASPAEGQVTVTFARTGKKAQWTPEGRGGSHSLLELAEACGLLPESSCRGGSCGSCKTKLIEGGVSYFKTTSAPHGSTEALLCCAVPAKGTRELVLDM